MISLGKMMFVAGACLAVGGVLLWGLGKSGFRGVPGDIFYDNGRVKLYFPLASCIVASVLLTLAAWVWRWLQRP